MSFAFVIDKRHACVWFRDDRNSCHFFHAGNYCFHTYGTVQSYGSRSHLLYQNCFTALPPYIALPSASRESVQIIGRLQTACAASSNHRLIHAQHGLCNKQIHACIHQGFHLFLICLIQFIISQGSSPAPSAVRWWLSARDIWWELGRRGTVGGQEDMIEDLALTMAKQKGHRA